MESDLHALAQRQHGVLLLSQARAEGWAPDRTRALFRSEGWRRIMRGAYLLPGQELGVVPIVAAVQLLHPRAVASGRAAALIHGLDVKPAVETTAPLGARWAIPGTVLRRDLADSDILVIDGLRVTESSLTVTDMLRTSAFEAGVEVLDKALAFGLTDLESVADRLGEVVGGRGTKLAWQAFRHSDPKSGSPLETRGRLITNGMGLWPLSQIAFRVDGGTLRGDLVIGVGKDGQPTRDLRAAVRLLLLEFEGVAYHGGKQAHQADVTRFNRLLASHDDVLVLRFTWDDVFVRPHAVRSMIRAALDRLARSVRAA